MTLDEVLTGLFPSGHEIEVDKGSLITGRAKLPSGQPIAVIGVAHGVALGTSGALPLAAYVLQIVAEGGDTPILVLVDTQGQLMARRDEMIGLSEYLAHLAKTLLLASQLGHRTIGLEYGKAAAGAFLATALAAETLIGLRGAEPAVMDMPSIARVTKMPEDQLEKLAKTTPVFAPGLDHMYQMGAVHAIWGLHEPLATRLEEALKTASRTDNRDDVGAERKGRTMAATVAKRVSAAANAGL